MKKKNIFALGIASLVFSLTIISCSKSSDNPVNTGPATTVIDISGMAFSPGTTTVKVGSIVKWTNSDGMTHTATSDNGTTFNTGNIAAGSSATYTTTVTGTFAYHCNIHSTMTATLVVIP